MREINVENFRRMLNESNMACKCDKCVEYLTVLTQEKANEVLNTIIKKAYDEKLQEIIEFRKLGKLLLDIPMEITQEDEDFVNKLIDEELERLDSLYDIFNKDNTEMSGQEFANVSFNSYKENQSSEIFIDKCDHSTLPNLIKFENMLPTNNCRQLEVTRNGKLIHTTFINGDCKNLILGCEDTLMEILPANEKYTYGVDITPKSPSDSFYFTAPVKGLGSEIIKYVIEVKPKSSLFKCLSTIENSEDECETYLVVGLDFNDTIKFIVTNISKTTSITEEIARLNSEGIIKQVLQVVKVNQNTLGVIANLTLGGLEK